MKIKRFLSSPYFLFVGLFVEIIGVVFLWLLIVLPFIFSLPFSNNTFLRICFIIFYYLFFIRFFYALLITLLMLINFDVNIVEFNLSKKNICSRGSIFRNHVRTIKFVNVRQVVNHFEPSMKTHYLVIVDDLGGDIRDEKKNSYIRIPDTPDNKRFLKSIGFVISKKDKILF